MKDFTINLESQELEIDDDILLEAMNESFNDFDDVYKKLAQ